MAASATEAMQEVKPLRGTRYGITSYTPTVGTATRPRTIHMLVLDGVVIDRGSKSDLTLIAKSAVGSPLGAQHAIYDSIVARAAASV